MDRELSACEEFTVYSNYVSTKTGKRGTGCTIDLYMIYQTRIGWVHSTQTPGFGDPAHSSSLIGPFVHPQPAGPGLSDPRTEAAPAVLHCFDGAGAAGGEFIHPPLTRLMGLPVRTADQARGGARGVNVGIHGRPMECPSSTSLDDVKPDRLATAVMNSSRGREQAPVSASK